MALCVLKGLGVRTEFLSLNCLSWCQLRSCSLCSVTQGGTWSFVSHGTSRRTLTLGDVWGRTSASLKPRPVGFSSTNEELGRKTESLKDLYLFDSVIRTSQVTILVKSSPKPLYLESLVGELGSESHLIWTFTGLKCMHYFLYCFNHIRFKYRYKAISSALIFK